MQLDPRTLVTVAVLLGLLFGLRSAAIWRTGRAYPGYSRWAVATLFVVIGLCLSSLRPLAPDWISIVSANTFIVISSILYLEGAREFRSFPPRVWLVYAAGVVAVAAVAFFDYVVPSLNARVAVMSLFIGTALILASVRLLENIPPGRKFAIRLIGALFSLSAAVLIVRGLYFVFAPPGRDVFALSTINSAFYAGTLLSVTGFTLGFHLLADERVMLELQRSKAELLAIADALEHSNHALERSNTELESFAYATTHDLREPLRTVTLYGQLLQKNVEDASTNLYLQTIIGAAERMEQLIQGVLEYSRVSREPVEPNEQVDLNEVLAVVEENLSAQIAESRAVITRSRLPTLTGSRLQLIRLMQNLIQNSLKYRSIERACCVNVRVEKQDDHWAISVQDNGMGFKPEYREYIFGMFKRLDRVRAGAGLGLAMCRAIVERYRGTIWAEGEEGVGAKFYFTWPIGPAPQPKANASRQAVILSAQRHESAPPEQDSNPQGRSDDDAVLFVEPLKKDPGPPISSAVSDISACGAQCTTGGRRSGQLPERISRSNPARTTESWSIPR